jgi:ABC-2 type transport system ATP-binding protein
MKGEAISVEGLRRSFGAVHAVAGLDFTVQRGEIFGFLGHNGAGKTTTVRLLNGVLNRDSGRVSVLGLDPARDGDALRARTGVLTESPSFDERFTARENLEFMAVMFSLPKKAAHERVQRLLVELGLSDDAERRVGEFSKGMKQKLAIARALLHEPEVIYFDEPTSGLDPVAARQLYDRMRALRAEGRAVFFTTHRLVEAAELCDRVAIVSHGKIVAAGTPHEIARTVGGERPLEVDLHDDDVDKAILALSGRACRRRDRGMFVDQVAFDDVPRVVSQLAAAGVRIYGVRLHEPTLEEAYLALDARQRDQKEAV